MIFLISSCDIILLPLDILIFVVESSPDINVDLPTANCLQFVKRRRDLASANLLPCDLRGACFEEEDDDDDNDDNDDDDDDDVVAKFVSVILFRGFSKSLAMLNLR